MEKLKIVVDRNTANDYNICETLAETTTVSRCGTIGVIVRYESGADETLKSVLAQTYKDLEVVVLATDKAREHVAKEFGTKLAGIGARLSTYGMADALEDMQAERVMLVDSKTELNPWAIALLAASLQNANADVVVGGVNYVELGKMSRDVLPVCNKMVFGKNNIEKEDLLEQGLFAVSAGKLFKRQFLIDAGASATDAELLTLVAARAKTIMLVSRIVCTQFSDNFDGGKKFERDIEELKTSLKGKVSVGVITAACVGLLTVVGVGSTMAQGETHTEYEELDSGLLSAIASSDASNLLAEIGSMTDKTETSETRGATRRLCGLGLAGGTFPTLT